MLIFALLLPLTAHADELGDKCQRTLEDAERLYHNAREIHRKMSDNPDSREAMDAAFSDAVSVAERLAMLEDRWTTLAKRARTSSTIEFGEFDSEVKGNLEPTRKLAVDAIVMGLTPRVTQIRALIEDAEDKTDAKLVQAGDLAADTLQLAHQAGTAMPADKKDLLYGLGLTAARRAEDWTFLADWGEACAEDCASDAAKARGWVAVARSSKVAKDKDAAASACRTAAGIVDGSSAYKGVAKQCKEIAGKAWK
jgi:hypothetical protein